jgi:hypothetical protein
MKIKHELSLLVWKAKRVLLKVRYPKAGYYERMCLASGCKRSDIDKWIDEGKKAGMFSSDSDDAEIREEYCEDEVSCWD